MESLLREILAAQQAMLDELRQIRLLLAERDGQARVMPLPDHLSGEPEEFGDRIPEPAEFTLEPETAPPTQPAGTFTPSDLKDLGQSFASPRLSKSRPGLIDVQGLRGSLLDEIKGKNRAKSRAFAEFSRHRRDD